jgi:hypothetical protein
VGREGCRWCSRWRWSSGWRWGQRVVALGRSSYHLQSTASESLALAWEARRSCRSSLPGFWSLDLLASTSSESPTTSLKARRLGTVQAFAGLLFPCSDGFR